MSTFDGLLLEYPLISVDRFTESNYASTAYFLSHCHTDHMKGLDDYKFHELLKTRRFSKIYVSPVSRTLLINDRKYCRLSDYLEAIALERPTMIPVINEDGDEELSVVVTLLPAGHCPGSVMFFFEGSNGNVLYTGDFRMEKGGIQHLPHINYEHGRVKLIKTLYLDATFCDAKSLYFPTRQQSIDAILLLVTSWIKKGPHRIVYFECPAKFGYESIFISLYEALNVKIHIDDYKYSQYKNIPELEDAITNDPQSTQIHACYKKNFAQKNGRTSCGHRTINGRQIDVRVIKPCAWTFAYDITLNDIVAKDREKRLHRVCFSTHSSLAEVWDVVRYIQPQRIHTIAVPDGTPKEKVLSLFEPLLRKDAPVLNTPELHGFQIPPLGVLKVLSNQSSIPSSGSLDFSYNIAPHQEVVSSRNVIVGTSQVEVQPCLTIESLSRSWEGSSKDDSSQDPEDSASDDSQKTAQAESSSEMCLDSSEDEVDHLPENAAQCKQTSIPMWKYSPPSSPLLLSPSSSSSLSMASLASSLDVVCPVDPPGNTAIPFNDPISLPRSDPKRQMLDSSSLSLTKISANELQLKKVCFQKNPDFEGSSLSFTDSSLVEADDHVPVHPHNSSQNSISPAQNSLTLLENTSVVADKTIPTTRDKVVPVSCVTNNMSNSLVMNNATSELRTKEKSPSRKWPCSSSMSSADHHLDMVIEVIDNSDNDSPEVVPGMCRKSRKETSFTYVLDMPPNVNNHFLYDNDSPSILDEIDDSRFDGIIQVNQNDHDHDILPRTTILEIDPFSKNKKRRVDPTLDVVPHVGGLRENCAVAERDIEEQAVILVSSDSEDEVSPTQDIAVKTTFTLRNAERWKINNTRLSIPQDLPFAPILESSENDEILQRKSINEPIPLIVIDD